MSHHDKIASASDPSQANCPTIPPLYEIDLDGNEDQTTVPSLPMIPGYSLGKQIGEGGMGVVHEATQLAISRRCAIKFLLPRYAKNKHFADRFKREAQVMARLQDPHIVQVLEFGESENMLYLIMIYIVGPNGTAYDLRRHLAMQGGRLAEKEACQIIDQIASALETAHHEGIVHRDVKPGNVLLDARKRAYVTDFGLAVEQDSQLTANGTMVGTINYMAPEQRQGINVDHRADIYSLTVMTYELLTGRLPQAQFIPVTTLVPGLQSRWDPLIESGLAPKVCDRIANLNDFRAFLQAITANASEVLQPMADTDTINPVATEQPTLASKNQSKTVVLANVRNRIQSASQPGIADERWRDAESAVVDLERLLQDSKSNPELIQLRKSAEELAQSWARQALTEACKSKNGSAIRGWAQRILDVTPEDSQTKRVLSTVNQQYQQLRSDLQKAQELRQLNRVEKTVEHLLNTFPDDLEVQRIAKSQQSERAEVNRLLVVLKQQVQAQQWCGVQTSLEKLSHQKIRLQQGDSLKTKARASIQTAKSLVARAKKQMAAKQITQAARSLTEALAGCSDCSDALEMEVDLRYEQTNLLSSETKLTQYIEDHRWRKAAVLWKQVEQSSASSVERQQKRLRIEEGFSCAKAKLTLQMLSLAGLGVILALVLLAMYPATLVQQVLSGNESTSLKKLALPILVHQIITLMGLWLGLNYLHYLVRGAWPKKSDMSFVLIFLLFPLCHLLPTFMNLDRATGEYVRMAGGMAMVTLIILSLSKASVGSIFKQTTICLAILLGLRELGRLLLKDMALSIESIITSIGTVKFVLIYALMLYFPAFLFWSADDWRQRTVLPKLCFIIALLFSVIPLHMLFPSIPGSLPWTPVLLTMIITTVAALAYDIQRKRRIPRLPSLFNPALIMCYAGLPVLVAVLATVGFHEMVKQLPSLEGLFDQTYLLNFATTMLLPWWCGWGCIVIYDRRLASTPAGWIDLRRSAQYPVELPNSK